MPQAALDSIRAVTFDMYGTLLDLETSFVQGFSQFLKAKGLDLDAAEVVRTWEAAYLHESTVDTLLDRGRTPFERVRRACLSQVFSRLGIDHTLDDVEGLLTSGARVSLFPDVQEGLLALRDRYTLAILSNGDLVSLEQAVSGLSIPVHRAISAEQAGAYKPHPSVYRAAVELLGLENGQVLHIAAHAWDIRGAKTFGLRGAYLNRDNVPFGDSPLQPDFEVSRLTELAGRLP
jgi:2-haloacid dehalogenase